MKLLFLSGARGYLRFKIDPFRDPSFIYRLHNPAVSAMKLGHKVGIYHLKDLSNPFFSKKWDVAIIHRPSFNSVFYRATDILMRNGIPIYGDFDDLIFSIHHASERPSVKNGTETINQSLLRIKNHLKAIECIDGVIVSNPFLKKHILDIQHLKKKCIIMKNSWHLSWKDKLNKNIFNNDSKNNKPNKDVFYLTYFSGTRTHDLDLLMITDSLFNVMKKHKNLKFKFYGKGNIEKKIANMSIKEKKIHFKKYHTVFSSSFVNLAPLEDTVFNNAKSAIKIIEAGFFGIKTVCSPNPDYIQSPMSARNIAYNVSDWEEQLNLAIDTAHNKKNIHIVMDEIRYTYDPINTTKELIIDFESSF